MKFVDNWRAVLKHAWSLKLVLVAVLFSVVEAVLPFVDVPVPPGAFAAFSALFGMMAGFARLVAQARLQRDLLHWEDGERE